MEAIIPAVIAAVVALVVGIGSARMSARGQERTAENEEERLSFQVWKDGQDELRRQLADKQAQIDQLRVEIRTCDADKKAMRVEYDDEIEGMRAANLALRRVVAELERQIKELQR